MVLFGRFRRKNRQILGKFLATTMAKTSLRLDTRRALKDGTYPVQIVVGHGTDIYLKTGIYAAVGEWDALTLQYTGKGARRVNSALVSMVAMISNRIMELKETGLWAKLTRGQIKQMLTDLDLEKPTIDVPTVSDVFSSMCEGRADRTKGITKSTSLKIQAFGFDVSKLHFEQITSTWLDDFYASMSGLSINTKAAYMKTIKRAFSWAIDHDITTNDPFRHYHIKVEETRMRDLPIEKMRQLIDLPLQGLYPEYRDLFLLTFYLIGINTVDLADCTNDSIVNGRLEYRRHKTNKLYSIKIEPEAMELINKYRGKKHLIRCFDRYKDYKALQGSVNNALAKMGPAMLDDNGNFVLTGNNRKEMQPLEKGLSLYWARYSWATYAADLDIPKDTISEALGHSHGAKVTGVYIKYNRDKVDAANRKVIDYVLGK